MKRETAIEVINRVLSRCDKKSLMVIYLFVIQFSGKGRTS